VSSDDIDKVMGAINGVWDSCLAESDPSLMYTQIDAAVRALADRKSYDHSDRATKHCMPGLGPCVCDHCVKLPYYAPTPTLPKEG